MQFIKVDIDGAGKKWRLAVLREQGTTFYFPKEDFEDFVENYDDCKKRPVPRPDAMAVVADELAESIGRIVDGEVWAGRVWCRSCAHEWVACASFGTTTFECPECGEMDGKQKFNCAEEASGRIATALVDVLGVPAKDALAVMENFLTQVIPENDVRRGWWKEALKFLAMG
jgi:predicted RNA-binding Zn-ribbon protein involved in translation (DUF1610 family)